MKRQMITSLLFSAGLMAGLSNLAWARPDNNWYFAQNGVNLTPNNLNPDTSCVKEKPCSAGSFTPQVVADITQLSNGQNAQFHLARGIYGQRAMTKPITLSGNQSIIGDVVLPTNLRPTLLGAIEAVGKNQIKNLKIKNNNQVITNLPSNPTAIGIFLPSNGTGKPLVTAANVDIATTGNSTNDSVGAMAATGSLSLFNSTITTQGGYCSAGLRSSGDGTQITTQNVFVSSPTGNVAGNDAGGFLRCGLIYTENNGAITLNGGKIYGRSQYLLHGSINTTNVDVDQTDGVTTGIQGTVNMTGGHVHIASRGQPLLGTFFTGDITLKNVDTQLSVQSNTDPVIGAGIEMSSAQVNVTGGTFKIAAPQSCAGCTVYAFGTPYPGFASVQVSVNQAHIIVEGNQSSAIADVPGQFSGSTCTVNNKQVNCSSSTAKFSKQDLQKMQAVRKKRQEMLRKYQEKLRS